jgi:hypothetical protein
MTADAASAATARTVGTGNRAATRMMIPGQCRAGERVGRPRVIVVVMVDLGAGQTSKGRQAGPTPSRRTCPKTASAKWMPKPIVSGSSNSATS